MTHDIGARRFSEQVYWDPLTTASRTNDEFQSLVYEENEWWNCNGEHDPLSDVVLCEDIEQGRRYGHENCLVT